MASSFAALFLTRASVFKSRMPKRFNGQAVTPNSLFAGLSSKAPAATAGLVSAIYLISHQTAVRLV